MVMRNIHPSEASIVFVIIDLLVRDEVAPLMGRKFNACSFVRYIPGLRRTEPPETENAGDRAKSSLRSFPPNRRYAYRTMPSNRFLYHLMVSCWLTLWEAPILLWHRLRLATRSPGRVMQT